MKRFLLAFIIVIAFTGLYHKYRIWEHTPLRHIYYDFVRYDFWHMLLFWLILLILMLSITLLIRAILYNYSNYLSEHILSAIIAIVLIMMGCKYYRDYRACQAFNEFANDNIGQIIIFAQSDNADLDFIVLTKKETCVPANTINSFPFSLKAINKYKQYIVSKDEMNMLLIYLRGAGLFESDKILNPNENFGTLSTIAVVSEKCEWRIDQVGDPHQINIRHIANKIRELIAPPRAKTE